LTITKESSLSDVAFAVCTALEKAGITAVLTGGSAATYYAPLAYQSLDLDFVIAMRADGAAGKDTLAALGYEQSGDYYTHRANELPLEFVPGPLMVGDDRISVWASETRGAETLYVLTPTDSLRDRLASLLFWNDFSGLEQAIAVFRAQEKKIDLAVVKSWCEREGHGDKYRLFEKRIAVREA